MTSFDFDRVERVHVKGLADFELIVAAHPDGDSSSVVISGRAADSVSVLSDGGVVTINGQDGERSSKTRSVAMSGTFVTGNVTIPTISVPKEPLRIRYGGLGAAPVTIEVALPPGQPVVLDGPFKTVTTAAPGTRSGGKLPRKSASSAVQEKAGQLLERAREDRSDGSLAGAIRGHVREQEARRLLEDEPAGK